MTLLQHFRSYLEGSEKPKGGDPTQMDLMQKQPLTTPLLNQDEDFPKQRKIKEVVYVKKWMRTRHAIMFRLSNKVV